MIHYEFFKREIPDQLTVGDEIALFVNELSDETPSGRYKVYHIDVYPEFSSITLIGMGEVSGYISTLDIK